jgi:ubiquinone/menaquinone biosynthesis C-methylase UbiE
MLAEARKKCPNTQFLHADITKEPVAVDSVDLVTSFRFFGNAQHDLRVAVLSKLQKIMRPGAYLIVNNHRNPRAISNILHRLTGGEMDQDLSYGKFEATLNAAGFRIVKTRPIAAWCVRSRMLATLQLPDARSERLESLFSNPLLSRIAPDTFLVAQRI